MATYSSHLAQPPVLTFMSLALVSAVMYAFLFTNPAEAMAKNSPAPSAPRHAKYRPGRRSEEVVEALKKTGKYEMGASLLAAVDLNMLPESTTLFVPTDSVASGLDFRAFNAALPILEYHVLTRQLSFHALQQLAIGTTLETLLTNSTVLITSNSSSNFTVDDVLLTHPDIFMDDNMAVHGINGIMNVSVYGKKQLIILPPFNSPRNEPSTPNPPRNASHTPPPPPTLPVIPAIPSPTHYNDTRNRTLPPPPKSLPTASPPTVPAATSGPQPSIVNPQPSDVGGAPGIFRNVTSLRSSGAFSTMADLFYMTKVIASTSLIAGSLAILT